MASTTSLSASQSECQLNWSGRLYRLSTVRSSPRFSMHSKWQERPSSGTPGPGSYTSSPTADTPSYGFGSSPRDPHRPPGAPGPGKYETQEPARVRTIHEFGRSPRVRSTSPVSNDWIPGPGSYPPAYSWGADGRRPSLLEKLTYGRKSDTPGPGTYALRKDPKVKPTTTGFGTAPKDVQHRTPSPGPAAYSIVGQASGPRFTMCGDRIRSVRAGSPGVSVARMA